jgi:Xaa-Pro aminopeptidase
MLTSEGCTARRKRLWDSLPDPCDVLVLTEPESLVYYASYYPSPFVFNTVESTAALVLRPNRSILIGDNLLRTFLDACFVDEAVALEWYTGKKPARGRRSSLFKELVFRFLPEGKGTRIGVESRWLGVHSGSRIVLLDHFIRRSRRTKDADEVMVVKQSVRAGEAAHAAALAEVKPGMSELDVYNLVAAAATRELGAQVLVYGDFASGPRCATERGGPPSRRVIESGDLFLLDFSVVVHGYRADFANTFAVGAEPSPRQKEFYQICMGALEAGESLLRPGVEAKQVDAAVRGHFEASGLAAFFPSHSGHGLGLGHPEPPYLVPESNEVLQPGDVVALEPGLYVPGVGGMRFERNYHITADGHETLTRHRLGLT